ncbi:MAG: OmpA family protein [Deltaproteobacteria bacterium]|nr:OmpA family protein [Deltaproteobacteria bacterium]
MSIRSIIFTILSVVVFVPAALGQAAEGKSKAKPATAKAINVTGKWNTNVAGNQDLWLHQEGNIVWGMTPNWDAAPGELGNLVRGSWNDGRLILFYRDSYKGASGCGGAPMLLVMKSKGTATRLDGIEFTASGETPEKVFERASPDSGPEFEYPYGAELKDCGSLPTHELAFDVNSDQLKGSEWSLLKSVAELLKKETGIKIRILGHTDSTGDATKNKDLSQRRAESVKKVLAQKYGADEKRISTKGWGDEQPLVTNDTEEGRAMNRRVEITVAR